MNCKPKRFGLIACIAMVIVMTIYYYYKESFIRINSYELFKSSWKKGPLVHPFNVSSILDSSHDSAWRSVEQLKKRLEVEDQVEVALEKASEQAVTERFSGSEKNVSSTTITTTTTATTTTIGPSTKAPSAAFKRRLELEDEVEIALEKSSEQMNILVYQLPFKPDPYMLSPDRKRCGNCKLLWDKKLVDDPDTKAVLFYFDQFGAGFPKRNPDQLWGFWTREAPPASKYMRGLNFDKYDNFFNFTMSFRRDADIWDPYETSTTVLQEIIRQADGRDRKEIVDELVAGKTGLVAWVVSNCGATPGAKKRSQLAQSLIDVGLTIDRRGGCFGKRVDNLRQFISTYKFYLAFENSRHCRDYITEKLTQNSLMTGAVPVVYGARKQDLLESMPPGSFIYAEDYTPTELTDYLNYLDQHEEEYKKYLMWRTFDHADMPSYKREANFCQLCRVLHGIHVDNLFNTAYHERYEDKPLFGKYLSPRTFPSITKWYYGSENEACWR